MIGIRCPRAAWYRRSVDLVARTRTEAVRAAALELGFDAVGVARADHADPEGRLEAWIEAGFAADLEYMRTHAEDRADPRRMVPGAKSVVALAMSYYAPEYTPDGPLKVSRYAVGDDYHTVVRKRIRRLRKRLLAIDPEALVMPTVDTSPMLERAWAERAGIAWIGKSTMAIGTRLGTYTFLATLITTMELEPDAPHADRCGTCTRCLDACPTDAFDGPYRLDARRCITYWNVEQRAAFDASTPALHGWLAGCDVCQEVCPWNKFARPTHEPRFAVRPAMATPDPEVFTAPERDAELFEAIRGTAVHRTGTAALRRNARRILGIEGADDEHPQ